MIPRGVRRMFRLDAGRNDLAAEVDDELGFHFEATVAELRATGLDEVAARAEAERRFGDVTVTRARLLRIDGGRERIARRAERVGAAVHDVRLVVRGLAREPVFTLTVAVTLGLGIGANATMVGLVDRLLFRPPSHVVDPGRVAILSFTETDPTYGSSTNLGVAWPDYLLAGRPTAFASTAAYYPAELTVGRGTEAERVRVTMVSASFFPLLGVTPRAGRFFTEEESAVGAGSPVVVLSERYWRRRFGADPAALGASLQVGNQIFTVIGVTPRGFSGVDLNAVDLWLPVGPAAPEMLGPGTSWARTRNWQWVRVLARLAPGATREQGAAALTALYRQEIAADPDRNQHASFGLHPVFAGATPDAPRGTKVAAWLAAVSVVVLLITCANVANLMLARGARRQRDIAVRLALGIRRRRLVGQLLLESAALSLLGGGLALLVIRWGGAAIRQFLLPNIDWIGPPLDPRVALLAGAATAATVLLAGLVPAYRVSRPDLTDALKSGSQASGRDPRHTRLRRTLLVTQTALSVTLLVGAGLFVRSLQRVARLDLGFEPRGLMVIGLDFAGRPSREARAAVSARIHEELGRVPGVTDASETISVPFWIRLSTQVRLPGRDSLPRLRSGYPSYNGVTPEFFATTGIDIVRGRGFEDRDQAGVAFVMVVNQTMARTFWPAGDAIGSCVLIGSDSTPPCAEVVGIAEDSRRDELREDPIMQYYVPLAQSAALGMSGDRSLFVRTAGPSEPLWEPVRRAALAAAPELLWAEVRPMDQLLEPQMQPWRLGAAMFTLFGALALLVAAVGLYGVLAYSVATRAREFGVRGALGASGATLVRQIVFEGVRLTALGLAIGAAGALGGARLVAGLLFDTSPQDPAVLAGVAIVLMAMAVAASLAPGIRAARVSPADALRGE